MGRVVGNLAAEFARMGLTVDLLSINLAGPLVNDLPAGVHIIDLHSRRTLRAIPALARYLRRHRVRHLLSASFHANLCAILASRFVRSGMTVHLTEHIALSQALPRLPPFKRLVISVLIRLLYPLADGVIAVSAEAAEDVRRLGGLDDRRVRAVMNPVVTARMLEAAAEPIAHPWLHRPGCPVVVAVGRLAAQKDFPTLLRAFSVVRRGRRAKLLILGEGEDRAKLERLVADLEIRDDVELLGHVRNPYPYLTHADLFVLSSAWEGLPTTLIEALALGVPVVSTDCRSGPKEILEGGLCGALVPVGGVAALARAMTAALEVQRGAARSAAPDLARYTPRFAAERYLDVFRELRKGTGETAPRQ